MNEEYVVEISGSGADFARFNIAVTCGCFDADGHRTGFASARDTVMPVGGDAGSVHVDTAAPRVVRFVAAPCESLLMYVYIIPHTLPEDSTVANTQPFYVNIAVTRGARCIYDRRYKINGWAGASLCIDVPGDGSAMS